MLRAAQEDADKKLPEDDLRVMDDLAFYGAISTFDKNRQPKIDIVLERYLAYLTLRAAQLEHSLPPLDTIRAIPITIPEPLSDASLPADFRAARAALASNTPGAKLSSCSILNVALFGTPKALLDCDGQPQDNSYTFEADPFTRYNANTKTTTNVKWTSSNQDPFDTAGVCWTYTNCSGETNDVFYILGTDNGQGAAASLPGSSPNTTTVQQGQSPKQFYWTLDQYPQPTAGVCDVCDPGYPDGQNPRSTNAPIDSTMWYFDYTCNVSPT